MVGKQVLRELAANADVRTSALVRRAGTFPASERCIELVFNYELPASYSRLGGDIPCDVLLCCLGTTIKKAGSPEAFLNVDRDYPVALIRQLASLPHHPVFGLVSSVGADRPRGLYLAAKSAVEAAVKTSGLPAVIVRPSILLGDRQEHRPGESLAIGIARPAFKVLTALTGRRAGWVGKYGPVEAGEVARTLVEHALRLGPGASPQVEVVEGWNLRPAANVSTT
jgi:uncharacterized protein YbjT (DUF2867 family)